LKPAKPIESGARADQKPTSSLSTLKQVQCWLARRGEWISDQANRWTPWILLILFIGVVSYYVWPRPKSFFLDLTTDHLSIVTDEDTQIVWELKSANVCLPRHKIDPGDYENHKRPQTKRCDENVYLELYQENIELDWPKGVSLVLRPGLNRTLDVVMRFHDDIGPVHIGNVEASSESILNLPSEVFSEFGGLGVTGQLVAGQLAENGTLMLLRGGKYETRERYWFRNSARMVDSGTFSLGDVVSIERNRPGRPLSSYAFLTLTGTTTPFGPTDSSLRAIVSSEETYSKLRLERARAKATFLEPSWAQRLSNDPLILGLATVLSLFVATLAVFNAFSRKRD